MTDPWPIGTRTYRDPDGQLRVSRHYRPTEPSVVQPLPRHEIERRKACDAARVALGVKL